MLNPIRFALLVAASLLIHTQARADDVQERHLTLKDHVFAPSEMKVPAGQRIKLLVENQDASAAEFESDDLHREKVVAGKSTITVFIGPLDKGTYGYFDDFHKDKTTGTIIAE